MSKKAEIFQKFATRYKPEVYNWLTRLDAHLLDSGCKTTATLYTSDGAMLDYVSKKTKMRVCKVKFESQKCTLTLSANHFVEQQDIIAELSTDILNHIKNNRGCPTCATPPMCGMNFGRYFAFTHNGERYECCGAGFNFDLHPEADFEMFDRWINHELAWSGEGALVNLDLRKKTTTKQKATDPLGVLPIYEQTNKQQRLNRPTVDGTCEYFLQDQTLRKGAQRLINLCRELGAEPKWISKNKFIARKLLGFRFEGTNDYNVCVDLAENAYHKPHKFAEKFATMPDDFVAAYIATEKTHCVSCKKDCDGVVNQGQVKLCARFNVYVNPTDSEVELIARIMRISMQ